jgi:hypothetical protein
MKGDAIELLHPSAKVLGHVAFEGVHCTGTECVRYDLALTPMFDAITYVEHAGHSRDESLVVCARLPMSDVLLT